jgi:cytochrome c553
MALAQQDAPASDAAEAVEAPDTAEAETEAPETEAPETEAPETEAPETAGPAAIAEAAEVTEADLDPEAAKKIFSRSCRACHGNKGQGAASYPSLADKDPVYIVEQLKRYRAGEKIGPNSILMIQHAKKLSDAEIASLAVYVTTAFE